MLSDSVDLVAESTRTPSNKSSASLTEARHCITYDWPEPTIHRRHSANTTNAFPPGGDNDGHVLMKNTHARSVNDKASS